MISNHEYRKFMIHNSNNIRDNNVLQHIYGNGKHQIITNKYLYKSNSDFTKPYGYEESDLKKHYLYTQSYKSNLFAPYINK